MWLCDCRLWKSGWMQLFLIVFRAVLKLMAMIRNLDFRNVRRRWHLGFILLWEKYSLFCSWKEVNSLDPRLHLCWTLCQMQCSQWSQWSSLTCYVIEIKAKATPAAVLPSGLGSTGVLCPITCEVSWVFLWFWCGPWLVFISGAWLGCRACRVQGW